jgi:peptidoglycan hydrolase CwlO-like protein
VSKAKSDSLCRQGSRMRATMTESKIAVRTALNRNQSTEQIQKAKNRVDETRANMVQHNTECARCRAMYESGKVRML